MKKIFLYLSMAATALSFSACGDDDEKPAPVIPFTGEITFDGKTMDDAPLILTGEKTLISDGKTSQTHTIKITLGDGETIQDLNMYFSNDKMSNINATTTDTVLLSHATIDKNTYTFDIPAIEGTYQLDIASSSTATFSKSFTIEGADKLTKSKRDLSNFQTQVFDKDVQTLMGIKFNMRTKQLTANFEATGQFKALTEEQYNSFLSEYVSYLETEAENMFNDKAYNNEDERYINDNRHYVYKVNDDYYLIKITNYSAEIDDPNLVMTVTF